MSMQEVCHAVNQRWHGYCIIMPYLCQCVIFTHVYYTCVKITHCLVVFPLTFSLLPDKTSFMINFLIEILAKALEKALMECSKDLNLCQAKSAGTCPLDDMDSLTRAELMASKSVGEGGKEW